MAASVTGTNLPAAVKSSIYGHRLVSHFRHWSPSRSFTSLPPLSSSPSTSGLRAQGITMESTGVAAVVKKVEEEPVVVVTGASRGIGRAIALTMGKAGWFVLLEHKNYPGWYRSFFFELHFCHLSLKNWYSENKIRPFLLHALEKGQQLWDSFFSCLYFMSHPYLWDMDLTKVPYSLLIFMFARKDDLPKTSWARGLSTL